MTLKWLKEYLKENSRHKLYSEQIEGIKKKYGENVNCLTPISSSKELIADSAKERDFVLLHSNGKIDKIYNENESNFGLYTWTDTVCTNLILAYPK